MRAINHISPLSVFGALVLAAAVVLFVGCGGSNNTANVDASNTAQVISITTGKAESRPVPAYIQATGSLIGDEISNIAPKIAGRVSNVAVNVGEFISLGSVIATLDDRDAKLRLIEANANVKQSIAAVRQAEARLGLAANGSFQASSIPEVRAANANWELAAAEFRQADANEKRYRELVESGDVAMVAYEQYRTSRETARARVNNARQQLDAAVNAAKQNNQAIKTAEAGVESARAAVQVAEQAVADTVIRAPFSGFISERQTAVGEFVTTASTIATIIRSNPMKIQIQISERDVPNVVIGRGVSISVDAYPDRNFAGTVTAVNPAIDQNSRSAIVEAAIENNDNSLRSGMFASARIIREGAENGIFVPKSAIHNDMSTQSYRAFVIEQGVAKLRVLQLGQEEADSYRILTGLNADEIVATSNLEQLYEGALVVH